MSHEKQVKFLMVFALVLFLSAGNAWAHKVNVYAYAEGDTVHVKGYFSNSPARHSKILVFTPDGENLLEGKTDDKGEFTFKASLRTDLTIQIIVGEGHTNKYILKAEELPDSLPTMTTEPNKDYPEKAPVEPKAEYETSRTTAVSMEDVEAIVEKVVENKIAPLRKMMLEQQEREQGASLERVIAGLGIIFGIMGLTMYLRSIWRKKES